MMNQNHGDRHHMELDFYCPRWGSEDISWPAFTDKVKASGYDGVEVYPLNAPEEKKQLLNQLDEKGLKLILLHSEMVEGKNFASYKLALERNLYELATYQTTSLRPQFITSQTGREYYTQDQMAECFAICDRISEETGIKIIQETHRNKWSYAAHVVKDYLVKFPKLELALDFSHWVCVSESFLQDQQEAIDNAIDHGTHLHARVGHLQGPQVTDPRAPENNEALLYHLSWWDRWVRNLLAEGAPVATITPEFGPHPYMNYSINSEKPIADQWDINCWMKDQLKERFAEIIEQQDILIANT